MSYDQFFRSQRLRQTKFNPSPTKEPVADENDTAHQKIAMLRANTNKILQNVGNNPVVVPLPILLFNGHNYHSKQFHLPDHEISPLLTGKRNQILKQIAHLPNENKIDELLKKKHILDLQVTKPKFEYVEQHKIRSISRARYEFESKVDFCRQLTSPLRKYRGYT